MTHGQSPPEGAHPAPRNLPGAILALKRGLAADPGSRDLRLGLAALYAQMKRFDLVLSCAEALLAERPADGQARFLTGLSLLHLGRADEVDPIIRGHDQELKFRLDLGHEAANLWLWEAARAHCRRALELDGGNLDAWDTLALLLDHQLRLPEALAVLEEAEGRFPPGSREACHFRFHQGLVLLLQGEYGDGFERYEARLGSGDLPQARALPLAAWRGEPLAGRTLLLRWEQGFGDGFMLLRYVAPLAGLGARVLVETVPGVEGLVAALPDAEPWRGDLAALPPDTLQAPLLSLPRLLGTRLETLPARVPYLRVPDTVPKRRPLEAALGGVGPRLGLVWAGNPGHARDRERSLPPDQLSRLVLGAPPGTSWFSLQMGEAPPPELGLTDLAPFLEDFSATAFALSRLDGLVSVDTGVAHLAGALGVPVKLLITRFPDWRWLLERRDSPWYPTVELWRQPAPGAWAPVVEDLLVRLAAEK